MLQRLIISACGLGLVLVAGPAFSVSVDISSGRFGASVNTDFASYFSIHGQDFSMSGGPTRSGDFHPTVTWHNAVPSGSMISLGGSATMNPFNTITYGGQTYAYSNGNFSFTTPLVLANFPPGQMGQDLTAPFTFSGQAFARNSSSGPPGHIPGPVLETFDLRGEGIATVGFQCVGRTACWYHTARFDFLPAAAPPPAETPPPPAHSSPPAASPPPVTESSGSTTSSAGRRLPTQPIAITGLHDLRQQLLQLKREWGVSTETSQQFAGLSAAGTFSGAPVTNPEPASLVLVASGVAGLWIGRFIRRRKVC